MILTLVYLQMLRKKLMDADLPELPPEKNYCKEIGAYNAEKTLEISLAARWYLSALSTSVASEQLYSHARNVFQYDEASSILSTQNN
uniref:HAT C-terminal dimerisation domain-containing protein n=1 Tax=Ditylenchus dipsaci TaxID=166011 RepID=A0A915D8B7_9BILA